jgi:hypothetical protein
LWERRSTPTMPESAGAAGKHQVSTNQLNQGSGSPQTIPPSSQRAPHAP